MNRLLPTAVLVSVLLAAISLYLAAAGANTRPPVTPGDAEGQLLALQQELADLRAELAALREAPPAAMPAAARTEVPAVTDEMVALAVQRWLEAHGATVPGLTAAAAADGVGDDAAALTVDAALHELTGDSNMWNGNDGLYRRLYEAGKLDELIERFKDRARENPNDPQAHLDLGNAYLAYLQFDQSKWQMSVLADRAFDEVLDIDENHWEARFTKAMSYSFWPDALGKKKDAIAHFERLAAQQDTMPAQDHEAQTYVILGNLLEQRGEGERAREVWQRGLRRHPNDETLRGLVGR